MFSIFQIGWASSLCGNKPQFKLNKDLISLWSIEKFDNEELNYKKRKKTHHQQQQKKQNSNIDMGNQDDSMTAQELSI